MTETVELLNYLLALGTVLLQVGIVVLFYLTFARKDMRVRNVVSKHALLLGFLAALGASIMTLVYSEVFGFLPCGLCWLERVFLYPQVVLLGIALWKNDVHIALYSAALSFLGAFIALYHHYIQMGGVDLGICPSSAVDCSKRILFEFGFVTFPLMAATLFVFLLLIMFILYRHGNTRL